MCGFLGTKPPLTSVVAQARELDYDKVDEEHRALLKVAIVVCLCCCYCCCKVGVILGHSRVSVRK